MSIKSNFAIHFMFIVALGSLLSCNKPNPNLDNEGQDQLKSLELEHAMNKSEMEYSQIFYVPIYSDIYVDEINQNTLLAATLSIRNTSFKDSLFISMIDYYNTDGALVRSYIDNTISLPPMATLNYVIKKEDDEGGSGANFMVSLSARNKDVHPLIQAIMIGEMGNKGFSFMTDAYPAN
jgi:hypothetical protein